MVEVVTAMSSRRDKRSPTRGSGKKQGKPGIPWKDREPQPGIGTLAERRRRAKHE
jgi:hypothetical protein